MTEIEIINHIAEKLKCYTKTKGFGPFGDDGFWLPTSGFGERLVLSTDSFVEGAHFTKEMGYFSVGWKSLVSALSDIFAMGASPSFYSLNLVLPKSFSKADLNHFLEGVDQASTYYSVKLLGGDVAQGDTFVAAYQVGGYQAEQAVKSNSDYHVGDVLLTNHPLGEAFLGFRQFQKEPNRKSSFIDSFLYPRPPYNLGPWLGMQEEVRSITDISDGLVKELQNIGAFKNVKIFLDELTFKSDFLEACKELKLSPEKVALKGGEEYSLLWTVQPDKLQAFLTHYQMKFKKRPLVLGRIGSYVRGPKIVYENQSLIDSIRPFEHFSS